MKKKKKNLDEQVTEKVTCHFPIIYGIKDPVLCFAIPTKTTQNDSKYKAKTLYY